MDRKDEGKIFPFFFLLTSGIITVFSRERAREIVTDDGYYIYGVTFIIIDFLFSLLPKYD